LPLNVRPWPNTLVRVLITLFLSLLLNTSQIYYKYLILPNFYGSKNQ
jgi:hypothetical protein